jgi:hypothetical protein
LPTLRLCLRSNPGTNSHRRAEPGADGGAMSRHYPWPMFSSGFSPRRPPRAFSTINRNNLPCR